MVFRTTLGALEGHLEPLWGHFRIRLETLGSLEGSWMVSWQLLGRSLGLSGASWGDVWSSWGLLGAALVCPWPVLKSLKIYWFLLYFETLGHPKGPLMGLWVVSRMPLGALDGHLAPIWDHFWIPWETLGFLEGP